MRIITDPDLEIQEVPMDFAQLNTSDVFRFAGTNYETAIAHGEMLMCLGDNYINLSTGVISSNPITPNLQVIVHETTLVVLPNV